MSTPERHRLSLDLSPQTARLLDHVSDVLGLTRAQVAAQALTDALPALVERSDAFLKRSRELETAERTATFGAKKRR